MSESTSKAGDRGSRQLLNCQNCDWHAFITGELMHADFEKEVHEKSIRNGYADEACPAGSVAWAILREGSEVA